MKTPLNKTIFETLMAVYSPNERPQWDYNHASYVQDVARSVAHMIVNNIAEAFIEYQGTNRSEAFRRNIGREITNIIWMNFPGGTTAEYAATKIIQAIGKEDEWFV